MGTREVGMAVQRIVQENRWYGVVLQEEDYQEVVLQVVLPQEDH
ncbi:MAG: hypothetical protein Greene101449_658 [Candidatus Peregrinibacteria bacterium Greene1014_49]|nr:MAG: hypothetical protein Greene101449_658 [Candidatus Peregrinibacteria bacterium Greene1014_49]